MSEATSKLLTSRDRTTSSRLGVRASQCRHIPSASVLILAIVVLSCLIASPAATESVRDAALTYSPWTKFCLRGQRANTAQVWFIGKDGRAVDGPYLVAAVLIEQNGETKKTLRVTLRPP